MRTHLRQVVLGMLGTTEQGGDLKTDPDSRPPSVRLTHSSRRSVGPRVLVDWQSQLLTRPPQPVEYQRYTENAEEITELERNPALKTGEKTIPLRTNMRATTIWAHNDRNKHHLNYVCNHFVTLDALHEPPETVVSHANIHRPTTVQHTYKEDPGFDCLLQNQ